MTTKIRFNCGEYLPGKKRLDSPRIRPPVSDRIPDVPICCKNIPDKPAIPKPPLDEYVCICGAACEDNPDQCLEGRGCIKKRNVPIGVRHGRVFETLQDCINIGFGEAPCWKCGVKCTQSTVPCPPPRTDLPRQIIRQCIACPPAREQIGDCARYPSLRECGIYCKSENKDCPAGPVTPDVPPRPVVIVAPITPVIVRGPITPTPYYRCVQTIEYCPPPFTNIQKAIRQGCSLCWTDLGNGTGRLPDGSIGPRPANCTLTAQQCSTQGGINNGPCRDIIYTTCPIAGPITPIGIEPVIRPPIVITPVVIDPIIRPPITPISIARPVENSNPPRNNTPPDRRGESGILNTNSSIKGNELFSLLSNNQSLLGQPLDLSLGITTNQLFEDERKYRVIDVQKEAKQKRVSNLSSEVETIYHTKFNLFQYPATNNTKLVSNSLYLNIFKPVVPEEIAYILKIVGSKQPWSEYPFTQLTKEKVLVSIRVELLKAFDNIKFSSGKKIPIDHFIETLRFLMTTNRLNEFDSQYFLNLANKHKTGEFLVLNTAQNKELNEQAALGIIAEEAINADPNQQENEYDKVALLRSRRLNTDIEAVIPVERLNGVVEPLLIQDAGIELIAVYDQGVPVVDSEIEATSFVELQPGHGYYFSAILTNGDIVPIQTQNNLSSTYYLPASTRELVLDMFNVDSTLTLRVEATSGFSEFENYVTSTPIDPMYFRLRLNSIGDLERFNPLVRSVSGYYDILESQEDIDKHIKDYGFNISKVYVDVDDPFLRYLQQKEIVYFSQADVSFEGMYPNKTAKDNAILSRNLAFGLIFVPVRGSKHNPFGGRSNLITYSAPYVRELKFINDINHTDNYISVKENLLIEKTGEYKVGMLETNLTQNIIFSFNSSSVDYSGLYFGSNAYTSTQPAFTFPITNRLVNQVIETNISGTYGLKDLTWWDIYSRLTAEEMAKIAFEIPKTYLDKLANGDRGYRIRHVLQRENITNGSQLGSLVDQQIIPVASRTVNPQIII